MTSPGPGATLQSTWGTSQRLHKLSSVMTIEAATTLSPFGGLCLKEVHHTVCSAVFGPVHQNVASLFIRQLMKLNLMDQNLDLYQYNYY